MHCKEFKENHLAFVDDTLAGIQLDEMRQHLEECAECGSRDSKIRRALLLVRNLPSIQPSPDFARRLDARLAASLAIPLATAGVRKRVTAAATLAAAAMIGYIAMTLYKVEGARDVMLAPVVASMSESDMASIASPAPAIVASASAGLAIWPAALFAEQAPVHFARARFASGAFSR